MDAGKPHKFTGKVTSANTIPEIFRQEFQVLDRWPSTSLHHRCVSSLGAYEVDLVGKFTPPLLKIDYPWIVPSSVSQM